MKKSTRPKWAKPLAAWEWKHLQVGQAKPQPTLVALRMDAQGPCEDCRTILQKVGK